MIFLDFETSCDVDIRKCGAYKYCEHPSLEVECMAWAVGDGENGRRLRPKVEGVIGPMAPAWMNTPQTIVAHNATFERLVIENYYGIKHHKYICTAVMAGASGLPRSLNSAAEALKLDAKKDMAGRQLFAKIAKMRANPNHSSSELLDLLEQLLAYCKQDVVVGRDLYYGAPFLSDGEKKLYELDQRINDRGVPIDVDFCERAERMHQYERQEAGERLETLTGGAVTSVSQTSKLCEWLSNQGVATASVARKELKELLKAPDVPAVAREVMEIRYQVGGAAPAKYTAALQRASKDGRVRGVHMMNGAHTGRWAGRGLQTQNLANPSISYGDACMFIENSGDRWDPAYELLYGDATAVLTSCVRAMIVAGEGKQFIVSDYSMVEPRVLAWMTQSKQMIKDFNGGDPYRELAARIYKKEPEEISKKERALGKAAILGLGYGMGVKVFVEQGKGAGVTPKLAETAHAAYHKSYPEVKEFWYTLQRAMIDAGDPTSVGPVIVYRQRDKAMITLPSVRKILYRGVEVKKEDGMTQLYFNAVVNGGVHVKRFWGGFLTENVIQATARDLLASALLKLDKLDLDVIMHVHDEVVVESTGSKEEAELVTRVMSTTPWWANGLELKAETEVRKRFWK